MSELLSFWEVGALGAIAFLGALVFGTTGFGAGLVSIPLAMHLVTPKFALALFAVADLSNALRIGLEHPRNAVRGEWLRLVPTIVIGTVLGVTLLVNLPRQGAMMAMGGFIIVYSLYALRRHDYERRIGAGWAWLAGLAGGITSTVFGAGGPPYVIYLSQRGLTKEQFRATLGLAALTSISLRVLAFLLTGLLLDLNIALAALAVLPASYAGFTLARRLYLRISRETLMRAVAVLLLASGASLLYRAL